MNRYEEQTLLAGQRSNPIIVANVNNHADTEKSPFLVEPVRLTPAWEETNLPNDELNFKGLTMERANMEINPPYDRLSLVFLTMVLHGIGTLTPWNMFITAKSYFSDYKLGQLYIGEITPLATNFTAYVGITAQIPNLLFNWINIFVQMGGNLTTRIVWSLFIEVLIFVITVALAMSDSSSWHVAFFWITMTTVVILNIAGGIYQNTVYGMAAKLPLKYTGAVVLGSNISGTFTSVVSIISSKFSSSIRTAAIYYFITAMLVLLLCFDTYFALPLNKFYRYHELKAEREQEVKKKAGYNINRTPPYWKIFKQAFPQLFNVFFVFFITLSIFPQVHSDIKRSDPNFWIKEVDYVGVMCFLTFNTCAMLGSLIASFVQWPKSQYLIWPVLCRIIFLPLFILCKYEPAGRIMPVYITNDWVYWILAISMGLSSGYLSSLGMMYAPKSVEAEYSITAGMFAAAMLITGIFSGIVFSMIIPYIVTNISW